jgi:hypothetical protein
MSFNNNLKNLVWSTQADRPNRAYLNPFVYTQEARKLMVAAILLEKSDPLSARRNFQLAVEKFDTFLQAVPPGPRFQDLVHLIKVICLSKSHW